MAAQLDKKYIKTRPYKTYSRLIAYIFFEGRPLTTKGQWINPFLLAIFSLIKKIPNLKKVTKPVFILGTGRSGTTILGIILSMHKQVGYLNEPKALWHKIYPYEDLIGSYSLDRASYRLLAEEVTPEIKKSAHKLFGAYLGTSLSKRLVDKYPESIFRIPFILKIFPDAKFIFLVRNGWSTCHSIDHWSDRLGISSEVNQHDWWGANKRKWHLLVEQIVSEHQDLSPFADDMLTWTNQRDMAAVEWIVTMREGFSALKNHPENIIRVDYESLCQTDNNLLSELIAFLDLEKHDTKFLKYAKETLKVSSPKKEFPLHPSIEKPFKETMRTCGYE